MGKDSALPPLPIEANETPEQEATQPSKGIFKRFTTRIRSPSTSNNAGQPTASSSRNPPADATDGGKRKKSTMKLPTLPSIPKAHTPVAVNSFSSPELRQQALRERGLLPAVPRAYRDEHGYMLPLSEQEAVIDNRRSVVVQEPRRSNGDEEVESEATRIREAWLLKNSQASAIATQISSSPSPTDEQDEPTQQEEDQALQHQRNKGSISASERAFALAATDNSMVIGIQQSPRLGTFVEAHSPTLPSPIPITIDISPLSPQHQEELDGSSSNNNNNNNNDSKTRTSIGSTTSMVAPHEVPLPDSLIPPLDDEPRSPTPEAVEKVARWLMSPAEPSPNEYATAPSSPWLSVSPPASRPQSPPTASGSNTLHMIVEDDPSSSAQSTLKSPSPSKSKPSPIALTGTALTFSTSLSVPPTAIPLALPSPPPPFEEPRSPRSPTLTISITPSRGRSMTGPSTRGAISLAPSASTSSGGSSRVPALSPTRTTASSITASEVPPTPTGTGTMSFARGLGLGDVGPKSQSVRGEAQKPVAEVIVEGPEGSVSEYGTAEEVTEKEVGMLGTTPRARPMRHVTDPVVSRERRKSITFGLFGRGSSGPADSESPRILSPKPMRSMSNLRRSVTGTFTSKLRPKSTLVVNTSGKPDFAHLPPSPSLSPALRATSPQPANEMPGSRSSQQQGLRPRQPLSPTIHNRGSILMSTKHIVDDESRRLSEMAFLDF